MDPFYYDLKLQSLGEVAPLVLHYKTDAPIRQLEDLKPEWVPYNRTKTNYNRFGLSLTSLKGETDGAIDLNSLLEYNQAHGTDYSEMSFRQPTPYWEQLSELTKPLEIFRPHLGRSHILKLNTGGFFPPHRDLGESFRLISFLGISAVDCVFLVNNRKVEFEPNRLYYVNTRLVHSLFSFIEDSKILVLNLEPNEESVKLVYENLEAK